MGTHLSIECRGPLLLELRIVSDMLHTRRETLQELVHDAAVRRHEGEMEGVRVLLPLSLETVLLLQNIGDGQDVQVRITGFQTHDAHVRSSDHSQSVHLGDSRLEFL